MARIALACLVLVAVVLALVVILRESRRRRALAEARQLRNVLRLAIDTIPTIVWSTTPDGAWRLRTATVHRCLTTDCRAIAPTQRRSPPRLTIDDLPRRILPAPNDVKSSAPVVVVQRWCGLVDRVDRRTLDRFTRDIWTRFDEREFDC